MYKNKTRVFMHDNNTIFRKVIGLSINQEFCKLWRYYVKKSMHDNDRFSVNNISKDLTNSECNQFQTRLAM